MYQIFFIKNFKKNGGWGGGHFNASTTRVLSLLLLLGYNLVGQLQGIDGNSKLRRASY